MYLSQGPAVSEALSIADLHVAGCGHVIHCHTVKVPTQTTQETLDRQGEGKDRERKGRIRGGVSGDLSKWSSSALLRERDSVVCVCVS